MKVHFLDARQEFTDIHDWISDCLTETHRKALDVMPLQPLDVVVQTGKRVPIEKGQCGYAPRPGVIFLTVDPDNPALRANRDSSLERMIAHELHHAARWDGPGYGATLGDALVSEGLAGHFVLELFGGPAEPWEGLPQDHIRTFIPQATQAWDKAGYNHETWFFGTGDLPNWLGYSMGFRLVERFLEEHPGHRASNLACAAAADFRSSLSLI